MMANWIMGSNVNRGVLGDPGNRYPVTPVSSNSQREALDFVLKNSLRIRHSLNAELLRRMGSDRRWIDNLSRSMDSAIWPVAEKVMGIQASTLTMILNPTTLGRVYDNEFLVEADKDAITLPEILQIGRCHLDWKSRSRPRAILGSQAVNLEPAPQFAARLRASG